MCAWYHCLLYDNNMCLNYKISAFLLVAVMITRIQYGSGEDCEKVKQCMVGSGITFQSVVLNPAATETLRKYFDILCR